MNDMRFNQPPRAGEEKEEMGESTLTSSWSKGLIKKILKILGVLVFLGAVALLGVLSREKLGGMFGEEAATPYSAIFLSNGQVYFGKIIKENNNEVVLNSVFYLQANSPNTSGQLSGNAGSNSFNLIKMGNELHGPTDELFINREQIVFYENLREDSKVVQSIKNYK